MSVQHDDSRGKKVSKRRLIKALASGGAVMATSALPNRWSKPVVDSVFIPAHAQTTVGTSFFGSQTIAIAAAPAGGSVEGIAHIAGAVSTPAHAGTAIELQRVVQISTKPTSAAEFEFILKMIESGPCPLDPSTPNEYSSFHTGTGTDGVGQSAPGTWCDGGVASANLTVIFHPDFHEAFGSVDGINFSITLVIDPTIPVATPCIDCPPVS